MKKINVFEHSNEILELLSNSGIFLNSKLGDEINTMTIGWGSLSIYWNKPIFIAPVRLSRHTHHIIDESGVFTVSIQAKDTLKKELIICGTKSGRDVDKFDLCKLTAIQGKAVDCPIIGEANIQIECKVIAKTLLDAKAMSSDIVENSYNGNFEDGDYHTLFFGEVVECYIKE